VIFDADEPAKVRTPQPLIGKSLTERLKEDQGSESDEESEDIQRNRFDTSEEEEEDPTVNKSEPPKEVDRKGGEGMEQQPEVPEADPLLLTKRELVSEEARRIERVINANLSRVR